MILSVIKKQYGESVAEYFSAKHIEQFLNSYIGQSMKSEHFNVLITREAAAFITEQELPLNEAWKLEKDQLAELKLLELNGSECLGHLKQAKFGFDEEVFEFVLKGVFNIVLKTPVSTEGNLSKLDNTVGRIKLQVSAEDEKPMRAIVRVRIPMTEEKDEE
jgi:hypothetical protein